MRVFYRFAPPKDESDDAQRIDISRCVSNAAEHRSSTSLPTTTMKEEVIIKDSVMGTGAAFRCTSAFIPTSLPATKSRVEEHAYEQELVFIRVGKPVVEETLRGHSQFLLAYGQTATGKTHTMYGRPGESLRFRMGERSGRNHAMGGDCRGLVPRIIESLFGDDTQTSVAPRRGITVALDVGCCEIYNETTRDLVAVELERLMRGSEEKCGPTRAGAAIHAEPVPAAQILQRDPRTWTNTERQRIALLRGFVAREDALHSLSADSGGESADPSTLFGYDCLSARKWKTTFKPFEASQVQRQLSTARFYSSGDCLDALELLVQLRESSATEANTHSSRSHFLVRLDAHVYEGEGDEKVRHSALATGHLLLIDLAGSESLKTTPFDVSVVDAAAAPPAVKQEGRRNSSRELAATRTREMRSINRSLLALKTVVQRLNLLSSRVKPASPNSAIWSHIPFKDSALTVLLEPYLTCHVRGSGGSTPECEPCDSSSRCTQSTNAQFGSSAILICCSQNRTHFHNTVASLRLGATAAAVDPRAITLRNSLRADAAERRPSTERSRSRSHTPHRTIIAGSSAHQRKVDAAHAVREVREIAMYKHECERLAAQCYQLHHDRESGLAELQRMRDTVASQRERVTALERMLQRYKVESDSRTSSANAQQTVRIPRTSAEYSGKWKSGGRADTPATRGEKEDVNPFSSRRRTHDDDDDDDEDDDVDRSLSTTACDTRNANLRDSHGQPWADGGMKEIPKRTFSTPPVHLIHSLFRRLSADPVVYSVHEPRERVRGDVRAGQPQPLRARDTNVVHSESAPPPPTLHPQCPPFKHGNGSTGTACSSSARRTFREKQRSERGAQRQRVVTFVSPSSHGAVRVVLSDGLDSIPTDDDDEDDDVHPQKLFS